MADAPKLVNITVDGKKISAPAGTLLIEACKSAGIEIPSFCYYPGLSLQAACRMCVVRIEKMPKLQTACRSEEHTSELQSLRHLVCRLLLEKKKPSARA